ncbi:MAG TPA: hypothetical protein VK084_01760, partial [Chitinophagaceae bacterium]|nr:hypothetical protein [Chitinophagaceae bacterium]
ESIKQNLLRPNTLKEQFDMAFMGEMGFLLKIKHKSNYCFLHPFAQRGKLISYSGTEVCKLL